MPIRPCPICQAPSPRAIDAIPSHAVIYYRCSACGHVWTVKTDDPEGPRRDVTVPRTPDAR